MVAAIRMTKNLSSPESSGQYHRIICMTGKNKGICYYLNGNRIVLGRLSSNDIQILDTQASREHIELTRVNNEYTLTDLKSQNGVMVNDLKVTQHKLKSGDKIIVGSTVFKYSFIEVKEEKALVEYEDPEDDEDEDEEEEEEEVKKKAKPKKKKGPATPEEKRKKLIYIAVAVMGLLFFMDGDDTKTKKSSVKKEGSTIIDSSNSNTGRKYVEDFETREKVEAYIHRGRREAREGNYFRAMQEFNLALTLDPNDGNAAYHLNIAKQRLDEKIKDMFDQATKNKDSLKYNRALGTYCAIYKLLIEYKTDERFIEAKKNVEDMAEKLGMKKSDNYCF
ncbi:FHA domain-containing protein [Halobacteriovorax sp. GFR7]|uniref:FHA domain-containing protein n=1 Tax=unclassified Halobacteriovorax TaxID=2639665 RepID=UPI003D985BD8